MSMLTLAIDASLSVGSAALLDGTRVVARRETPMRDAHHERLLPAVAETLAEGNADVVRLSRIVCGEGPGSFTSLRIAASIAKGIAVAREIPLLAVPSLLLTVAGLDGGPRAGRYLSVLDAMRGESFAACYAVEADGDVEEVAAPAIAPTSDLPLLARELGARLIGPRMELDARPSAAGVARLGSWLARATPVDLASWEPLYGRLAEAQVRWEAAHGRPLGAR
jgi:tRNA threonylcarbamoyladenosine biosynthesis protein TsaB